MDPADCVGQTFHGKIKSYSAAKGYGFVVSEDLAGDLFFVHKNLTKDVVRAMVDNIIRLHESECTFTCDLTPEGKPGATQITLTNGIPEAKGKAKGGKGKGGKGKDSKGKGSKDWGYDDWSGGWYDDYESYSSYGKAGKGFKSGKGDQKSSGGQKSKGSSKGGSSKPSKPKGKKEEEGTPLCEGRMQAKMKSYSNESKWGFAVADPAYGDYGDIFVHSNNLDQSLVDSGYQLRDGDMIECQLNEIGGKPVAKEVTIVPQEATNFNGQFVKGNVKSFQAGQGYGFINAPRVRGDVWFAKNDLPASMQGNCVGYDVMFRLTVGQDGKAKAKNINALEGMEHWEAQERALEVIELLRVDGYIDETAVKTLSSTHPTEFLAILPDLEFYRADNPSSFILGALSRQRKAAKGGKGGRDEEWGKGYDQWGGGKGYGGKGKARYGPY